MISIVDTSPEEFKTLFGYIPSPDIAVFIKKNYVSHNAVIIRDDKIKCLVCGEMKDKNLGYHNDNSKKTGKKSTCKDCCAQQNRDRYVNNLILKE